MKKVLAMILSLTLVVTLTIGGSIAYLTSEDSDVNVMTLGNVQIDQIEQERKDTAQMPDAEGNLIDFGDAKPLYPAIYNTAEGELKELGANSIPWANEDKQAWKVVKDTPNVVDKFVTVKNTGKSDAYVRTIIAFEGDPCSDDSPIHVVHNGSNLNPAIDVKWIENVTIDGARYDVGVFTYPEALAKDETTVPSLKQVYMDCAADNEHVQNDDNTDCDTNNNGTYDILVLSQAVQAQGFDDAKTALETAFPYGDNNVNLISWFNAALAKEEEEKKPVNGDDSSKTYEIPADAVEVSSADELAAQVAEGKRVFKLAEGRYDIYGCGNGKNLEIYGASKNTVILMGDEHVGEHADYGFDGSTVKFYGLTFDSTDHINDWPGFARMNAEYYDCDFNGRYDPIFGVHNFNYCTFNINRNTYNCWIYGAYDVTYNHCTFNCSHKAIYIDGSDIANAVENQRVVEVKVNNCIFNGPTTGGEKAALETGKTYNHKAGQKYELNVNNTTVNGFVVNPEGISTNSTLWANKHSLTQEQLNVVVDGVDVY